MSEEFDRRRRGRDDLVRVIAKQEIKEGRLPDMRRVEQQANRIADRADARVDRNIRGGGHND